MTADREWTAGVLVWFEDNPRGREALASAHAVARERHEHLTVVAVATQEQVIGCGRCLQGTVLWNLEMKKIAQEELLAARELLGDAADVSYRVAVGDPVEVITEAARRAAARTVVLPRQRSAPLCPPNRRNLGERVGQVGPWQVLVGPARGADPASLSAGPSPA